LHGKDREAGDQRDSEAKRFHRNFLLIGFVSITPSRGFARP